MSRTVTQEERYRMMTEKPISRLIPGLAVPTIISMLITSIYNMADTFFVSQINTSASAAVGIIFSLMAMIQAVGFTLGMGAGNYISRSLGAKNEDIAVRTAATAFFTAIGIGVVMAVTGLSFLDRLVRLLGATETIAPYARDYARYVLLSRVRVIAQCHGRRHQHRTALTEKALAVPALKGSRGGRHGHKSVRQLLHPVFPV